MHGWLGFIWSMIPSTWQILNGLNKIMYLNIWAWQTLQKCQWSSSLILTLTPTNSGGLIPTLHSRHWGTERLSHSARTRQSQDVSHFKDLYALHYTTPHLIHVIYSLLKAGPSSHTHNQTIYWGGCMFIYIHIHIYTICWYTHTHTHTHYLHWRSKLERTLSWKA